LIESNNDNSVVLGDELEFVDYIDKLSECDLLFIPSRSDAFPMVSLDALSMGIPIACSKNTGTWTVLQDDMPELVSESSTTIEYKLILSKINKKTYQKSTKRVWEFTSIASARIGSLSRFCH